MIPLVGVDFNHYLLWLSARDRGKNNRRKKNRASSDLGLRLPCRIKIQSIQQGRWLNQIRNISVVDARLRGETGALQKSEGLITSNGRDIFSVRLLWALNVSTVFLCDHQKLWRCGAVRLLAWLITPPPHPNPAHLTTSLLYEHFATREDECADGLNGQTDQN